MKAMKKETAPGPEISGANAPLPDNLIEQLEGYYGSIEKILDEHAARLSPKDRRHLNGVGIATLGFIQETWKVLQGNSRLLPYHVPLEKFSEDYERLIKLQSLYAKCKQTRDLLWNITLLAEHAAYANARAFYGAARLSAKSKIKASETVYNILFPFFRKTRRADRAPTQKEVTRDFNALLHGKRDGEVTVRNVKPKVIKGRREVIVREEGAGNGE